MKLLPPSLWPALLRGVRAAERRARCAAAKRRAPRARALDGLCPELVLEPGAKRASFIAALERLRCHGLLPPLPVPPRAASAPRASPPAALEVAVPACAAPAETPASLEAPASPRSRHGEASAHAESRPRAPLAASPAASAGGAEHAPEPLVLPPRQRAELCRLLAGQRLLLASVPPHPAVGLAAACGDRMAQYLR